MNLRIFAIALTGFVLSALLGVASIQLLVNFEVRNQLDARLEQESVAYRAVIQGLSRVSRTLFDETINTPKVTALVHDILHTYGDERDIARGRLLRELYPSYKRLQQQGIRQLHFHGPDGLSLLRFHSPLKYGDSLFELRESVRLANTELKPVEGFEVGRLFHGFRFVFPLFYEGEHIGSVESSVSFKTIEDSLQALVPNELFEFVLNRSRVFSMLYPSERSIYQPFGLNDEYVIEDIGAKLGTPRVVPELQRQLEAMLVADQAQIRSRMATGKSFGLTVKFKGQRYAALFVPIVDVAQEMGAYILTFTLVPEIENTYRNGLWIQLSFLALMASLAMGYYRRQASSLAIAREREKLQSITERMAEGLFVQDTEGCITFLNEAAEKILGVRAQDVIGQVAHDLFHVHYDAAGCPVAIEECPIRTVTQRGEVYESENEYFRRASDQQLVPVQVTSAQFLLAGEPMGSITIFRDITQRKRDEEQLKLSDFVFSNTQKGIVVTDAALQVLACNDAFVSITGYARDEWLGQHIRKLRSAVHDDAFYETMWADIAAHGHWEGEVWNRRKDGSLYPQAQTINAVRNDQGQVTHYVSVLSDITERKRYEEELKRARHEALESAHAKSEFLANMSHEIRTPMNGILGMLELVQETELSSEQKDFLGIAQSSGRTLMSLLNSLLDLSKYEAGKVEVEQIDFRLRRLLEETVKLFAPQAQGKGLEIAALIDDSIPEYANGDPTRLRQVITNLLGNAIKFTEQGEVILSATVLGTEDTGLRLQVVVKDTGIGIAPEAQNRIFDSFSQADGSTTRKYGGTGLGLTLSREIVTQLGGQLWLESELGQGSAFHFTMQLRGALEPAALFVPNAELRGLRALIVDDNATNRLIVERYCDSWNIFHQSARDGEAALRLMEEAWMKGKPFDLVLTDMMMPEMDGIELAKRIRADQRFDSARLILITSYTGRALHRQADAAGFICMLAKPIGRDELHDAIERAVAAHPQLQQQGDSAAEDTTARPLNLHVLLAEDNEVNRLVATASLDRLGCTFALAENGEEALQRLKQERFDLVLMDCQMPVMDGLMATRKLREYERQQGRPAVPVIAMTAFVSSEDIQRCLEAGMDAHIGKPFDPEALRALLLGYASEPPVTSTHADLLPAETDEEETPVLRQQVLDELDELLDGELDVILQPFIEQLPQLLEQLRTGLETDDLELSHRAAHTLKSSAANVGGMRVSELAKTLEHAVYQQESALLQQQYHQLADAADELIQALTGFMAVR